MSGESEPLRILHVDDDLVAISKPAGLTVHRGPRSERDEQFVLQTLARQIDRWLYPVHRLDRNTSGVMVFALSKVMAAGLQAALQDDAAEKEYLVLARGEAPLVFASDRPLTGDNGEPQPARTEFRRLTTFPRSSLLAARIHTGRTHQIRRHLAHLAHHVIGDSTYGKGRINKWFRERGLPRMFLHARRLVFDHPRTGERVVVRDPLAPDLAVFLRALMGLPSTEHGATSS